MRIAFLMDNLVLSVGKIKSKIIITLRKIKYNIET